MPIVINTQSVVSIFIDYFQKFIFVLLQVTLIKVLTTFVYSDFIESFYHSQLHIFYNHWENNKQKQLTATFYYTGRSSGQSSSVKPSSLIVASPFGWSKINNCMNRSQSRPKGKVIITCAGNLVTRLRWTFLVVSGGILLKNIAIFE